LQWGSLTRRLKLAAAMQIQQQDHIPLDEGWNKMEGGFSKFIDIMEGGFREPFALALHSELYT